MTADRAFLLEALQRVIDGRDVGETEFDMAVPDPLALGHAGKNAWEELSHWADDDDIRARDGRYAAYRRERMRRCLAALKMDGAQRPIAGVWPFTMLVPMPSRIMLLVFAHIAAHAAAATTPTADPETAKRMRALREERTYPLPSEEQVNIAEQVLASQPCIGGLDKWNRRYARKVDWRNGHVDRDLLWFRFREAGLYGYRSGRTIGRLADIADADDRQFRYASGTYNLRTHRVTFDACGFNWPERTVTQARERRR